MTRARRRCAPAGRSPSGVNFGVAILKNEDGFEFETVRKGRTMRCVCRGKGRQASVEVRCEPPDDPDLIQSEQLELLALNCWHAGKFLSALNVQAVPPTAADC